MKNKLALRLDIPPDSGITKEMVCSAVDIVSVEIAPNENREIGVVLVSGLTGLNRKYRGVNRDTDVLTFRMDDDMVPFLGEIIVNLKVAEQRAGKEHLIEETIRLIIHGLLHLYGYRHASLEEMEKMESLESCFLQAWKESR